MNLVVYGPPGAGKTTVGRLAARALGRDFVDGDAWLEQRFGRPIADYFYNGDVALFRAREAEVCRELATRGDIVIAPGGGALLDSHSRAALQGTGAIFCLHADFETLLARVHGGATRPLLAGDAGDALQLLLQQRDGLYASFDQQVNTKGRAAKVVAEELVARFRALEHVRLDLPGSFAVLGRALLGRFAHYLQAAGLGPPFIVISDSTVEPLHGARVAEAIGAPLAAFPAGEAHKTLATVQQLYSACLAHGLERGGTIVAVGGGVVGDVAGFVAATVLRGVAWANVPTTVLAMADASLGGKVGVDLPQGKNLVGAFHAPALIVADTNTLATLPAIEKTCGMAEVVKSAIIGDPNLFACLAQGDGVDLEKSIARAAAVKTGVVNADPYEHGERAVLNLGHTFAHALEVGSGYRLRHGEAVAIGIIAAARLARHLGVAEAGLVDEVECCLRRVGLPARASGLVPAAVRAAMVSDKKKAGGRIKFVLPRRAGDVIWGQDAGDDLVQRVLEEITHDDP